MPGIMYERNILRGVKNRFVKHDIYRPFLLSLTPRRGTYVMTSLSLSIPDCNKLAEIGLSTTGGIPARVNARCQKADS